MMNLGFFMNYVLSKESASEPTWHTLKDSFTNITTNNSNTADMIYDKYPNIQKIRITGQIFANMGTNYYSSSDRSSASCGSKSVSRNQNTTGTASETLNEEEITINPDSTSTTLFSLAAYTYGSSSTCFWSYNPTTGAFAMSKNYSGNPGSTADAWASINISKVEAFF